MSEPSPQRVELSASEQSARLNARLQLVMEVGRASLTKPDMEELLNTVAQSIHRHFAYYDVTIFLVDQESQECVLVAQSGAFKSDSVRGYRQKLSVGIVGWVAANGRTVVASAYAWIRKPAEVDNGKEIGNREWVLDTADMDIFIGGSEA